MAIQVKAEIADRDGRTTHRTEFRVWTVAEIGAALVEKLDKAPDSAVTDWGFITLSLTREEK